MRLANLILIAAVVTLLASSSALSAATELDQATEAKTAAQDGVRFLNARPRDDATSKMFVRAPETVDGKVDDAEERGGLNINSLLNIFRGSSARKAAKAVKAAEAAAEKLKLFKMYGQILDNGNVLYPKMALWRAEGTSARVIYMEMRAVGRTVNEAETIFHRYNLYLQDMMKAATKLRK